MPVTLTAPAQLPSWPKNAAPAQNTPSASSSSSTAKPSRRDPARLSSSVSMSVMVCAVRGAMPVSAQTRRTSESVIVHRMALPAAEAYGTSRWPSGV